MEASERTFYIYCHTAPNGKRYIGQTCAERPERRWGKGYKGCTHMEHAIEKYGWENFKHDVLATCCNKEMANRVEMKLIELYDTTNPEHGYNILKGGRGRVGFSVPEETRRKISEALTGRVGHKPTEETRRRMSESMRAAYKNGNMHFSEEAITKRNETLRAEAAKSRRPICQFDLDGQFVAEYESVNAAVRETGFHQCGIVRTCQLKHRQSKGYIWRYKDSPETFPRKQLALES